MGVGYTFLGLVLFLTGVNVGFRPLATCSGSELVSSGLSRALIPLAMLMGWFIIDAEPAVHILNKQVEELTSGAISAKAMGLSLSVAVALANGLAMVRVLTGLPILYFLVPGYAVALGLSFFVPRTFTAIAFDSGGVASGPLTATFMLPLAMGACTALGGNRDDGCVRACGARCDDAAYYGAGHGRHLCPQVEAEDAGARDAKLWRKRDHRALGGRVMELYYVITISDRDRAEILSNIYQAAGTGMVLTKLGRGTATGEQLSSYGLDATEKAIVSTVGDSEQTRQIFKLSKRRLFIDVPGNGVMMAIPLKSVAGGRTLGYLTDSTQTGGKPAMDFSHELIMVIMNEGYSDTVMDAARSAGAGGGTVLHAKGTGRARAQKFFGVSLADEKDVVYIVAHADEKAAIMQAIADNAGPGTRAGAICFSLPISQVAGLRERDE